MLPICAKCLLIPSKLVGTFDIQLSAYHSWLNNMNSNVIIKPLFNVLKSYAENSQINKTFIFKTHQTTVSHYTMVCMIHC